MCGIVSIVSQEPIAEETLASMRDQLVHRGPDGAGLWIAPTPNGYVGFGHRRLAIIDLTDAGAQPMSNRAGTAVLNYNGEIYNYIELRQELRTHGHTFDSESDTEVLLAAYEQWGFDCLARLNGMFAFTIWDARRNVLFCARDRFGEKPLFHAPLPRGIAIASEMKALFAHPAVTPAHDPEMLDRFLRGSYAEEGEETLFHGVRRLPAAHAMIVSAEGSIVRTWRYWTPTFLAREGPYDIDEEVEQFGELLQRSVEMRLRSDVPVGTSLSGGLDSSVIVALLATLRDTRSLSQNAFSSRFDHDPTMSEGPEIDLVARATGVRSFGVTPDPNRLVDESERLHRHQEEPFLSASIYLQWCVMRLACEHDTTVLLDGQGADELLGGYQYYFPSRQLDLLDRGAYVRAFVETLQFSRRLRAAARNYDEGRRRFNADVALNPRRLARAAVARPEVTHNAHAVGVPPALPTLRYRRRIAEALQYDSLPILLRYADRNAMAFSRETRFPFLDYDLVEHATRLPDDVLVRNGWQKYVLRRAAGSALPRSIRWRADKVGYAAPLDRWLRHELREWAADRLFSGPVTELEQYDAASVRETWRRHQQRDGEHSWALWKWISVAEWLTLFETGRWTTQSQRAAKVVG